MGSPFRIVCALASQKTRDIVAFSLESQFEAVVFNAATSGEAVGPFLRGKRIHLLIVEYPDTAESILRYIQMAKVEVEVILHCREPLKGPLDEQAWAKGIQFAAVVDPKALLESIQKIAGAINARRPQDGDLEGEGAAESEFVRVNVDLFKGMTLLQNDVYIRIGADKFLKIFNQGDAFDSADRQKFLLDKKIDLLYIKKEESVGMLQRLRDSLLEAYSKPSPDPAEVVDKVASVQEAAADVIQKLGVTPEVQDVIKVNVMMSIKTMGSNPKLKNLLKKLTTDPKKYLSSHSVMMAQVACALSSACEWGSQSTFQKLTMACFLHDISLTDQELGRIQTKLELQALLGKYTSEQVKEYLLHTMKGAELVRQFAEIPPDVDTIVAQHHEKPDGSGFPRGLNHKQIAPLSAIFIVSHDLITEVFKSDGNFDFAAFVKSRKETYVQGNFRKLFNHVQALEIIFD